jgi:hypothetical protein
LVAEVRSENTPERHVWVIDSEGDPESGFLMGAFPDAEGEGWFEALSGACAEERLVARSSRPGDRQGLIRRPARTFVYRIHVSRKPFACIK